DPAPGPRWSTDRGSETSSRHPATTPCPAWQGAGCACLRFPVAIHLSTRIAPVVGHPFGCRATPITSSDHGFREEPHGGPNRPGGDVRLRGDAICHPHHQADREDVGILDLAIAVANANQRERTHRLARLPADIFSVADRRCGRL